MKRIWIGAVAALVLLAVVAVVIFGRSGGPAAAPGKETLIVGDQRGGAQSLLQAAGELDDVPYPIEWALFPAASPLLEALKSGAIDIDGIGGSPFAFAYAGGAPIKVVFAARAITGKGSRAAAIIVPANSPIRTWADLKGKKLATVRGSAGQDLALNLFARHGLKPNDVTWVYLSNSESKAALESGSVDAWSSWGSYTGYAVLKSKARILANGSELPAQAGFYAANDKAIASKRAQIQDFLDRISRAREWALTHTDEYAQVLAKETGLPVDVAKFTVDELRTRAVPIDESVEREQLAILERYRQAGLIAKVPDLKGAFDSSFHLSAAP
ncbi:MAG: ABC transporter substrate-binding protein [Sphingobium sp.]